METAPREEQEVWKDIPGFEGFYQASTLGRVRSCDRDINYVNGHKVHYNSHVMATKPNHSGYMVVGLNKNNRQHWYSVHQLIARTFIPNPNGYPQINHIDECRTNNAVINLEWCTAHYNNNYGQRNERLSKALKSNPSIGAWCKKPVIATSVHSGESISFQSIVEAADYIGIHAPNISAVLSPNNIQKTAGGYTFKLIKEGDYVPV